MTVRERKEIPQGNWYANTAIAALVLSAMGYLALHQVIYTREEGLALEHRVDKIDEKYDGKFDEISKSLSRIEGHLGTYKDSPRNKERPRSDR
jgi:hypothetical protein